MLYIINSCPQTKLEGRLPSSRQHLDNCDCLEDKREDCQNCSVLYCVLQQRTVICTHTCEQLLQLSVGLGLGFCFLYVLFLCAILFLYCLFLLC